MQLPEIKKLAASCTMEQLRLAEEAMLNEQQPAIEVGGKDEGEQLTHILAAIEILHDMQQNRVDLTTAIRNYTQRVRNSIG